MITNQEVDLVEKEINQHTKSIIKNIVNRTLATDGLIQKAMQELNKRLVNNAESMDDKTVLDIVSTLSKINTENFNAISNTINPNKDKASLVNIVFNTSVEQKKNFISHDANYKKLSEVAELAAIIVNEEREKNKEE